MLPRDSRCSRRRFLASAAALTVAGSASASASRNDKRLAVLGSVYRPLSYLYHLAGRFLHGYPRPTGVAPARVHSLWVEQTPENDLSREYAHRFGVRRARTVHEALIEDGKLAVDGVLVVTEHGNYPRNDLGQILYPRFEIVAQVVEAFRETGRAVPVFVAKHLSHDPAKARQMVAWSSELGFPLLAGSTLPTAERRPPLEPLAAREALVAAYGPTEVYGSDALDALHALTRPTGVRAVTCLSGTAVWRAGDAGRWSWDLLHAALSRSESANLGDVRTNCGTVALPGMPALPPAALLIEYADGTRGSVLLLNGHVQDFTFAARADGEARPVSCLFHLPPAPGAHHFDGQAAAIERMLATGVSPVSAERSLLPACVLAAAMASHSRRGERVETPELAG